MVAEDCLKHRALRSFQIVHETSAKRESAPGLRIPENVERSCLHHFNVVGCACGNCCPSEWRM